MEFVEKETEKKAWLMHRVNQTYWFPDPTQKALYQRPFGEDQRAVWHCAGSHYFLRPVPTFAG